MDADSKRRKRRENVLSSLDAAIGAMNLAQEISNLTPAEAVFGSVSILLTMIKVHLPFRGDGLQIHVYSGLDDQQNRLRRARASLRRRMSSPSTWNGLEEIG